MDAYGLRMTISRLSVELSKYQLLREQLLESFPDEDAEGLADTLEGITDLHEMIAAVIRSALVDEALQRGLSSRLEEMKQRLVRLDQRSNKKRELALEAMTEVGLRKLEQADFTASVRSGSPRLVVITEGSIPGAYWIPQPPRLDRQSLLSDLKRGDDVPGAQLGNPKPVLTVRTK